MTALFAVLSIDAFRARRDIPTPVLAVACALVARFLLPGQMLLAAFALFTVSLLARHAYNRKANAHAAHALPARRHRRRNAVLSILGGTAIHVALATAWPPADSGRPAAARHPRGRRRLLVLAVARPPPVRLRRA